MKLLRTLALPLAALPAPAAAQTPQSGPPLVQALPGARVALPAPQQIALPIQPPSPVLISTLPFNASQSGYYLVTQHLEGVAGEPGILVTATNVVIDLGGFVLRGVPGSLSGIDGADRTTVVNGTLRLWGGDGAALGGDGLVSGVAAIENGASGFSTNGVGTRFVDCIASGNGLAGIEVTNGAGADVLRCRITSNGGDGIAGLSHGSVVSTSSTANGGAGIAGGEAVLVEGCAFVLNASGAVLGEDGIVRASSSTLNAGAGFSALSGSVIEGCTSRGDGTGIRLLGAGRVERCVVTEGAADGIEVSDLAQVLANDVSGCAGRGIAALGAASRIDGNHVGSCGVGIAVPGTRNLVVRNSLDSNGVQTQIGPDNVQGPLVKTKGFLQNDNPWANFDLSFPPQPN